VRGMISRSKATLVVLTGNLPLLLELIRRDIRGRFVGARFGLLWSLFNPAIQLLSYGLIFGFLYGSSDPQRRSVLVSSLFCGLFPWWAFQEGTMRGMAALVDQATLLKRIPLPPVLPVVAATTASFALQMVGFLIFLAVFSVVGLLVPTADWFWLPAVMSLSLVLSLTLALVLAPLYLVVRDTLHVVTALLTIGFFASPVLYDLDFLPASLRFAAECNPMAALLGFYRAIVLGTEPPATVSVVALAAGIGLTWALAMSLSSRLEGRIDEYW
jgi:lipopolysaccharide transport system permease protein